VVEPALADKLALDATGGDALPLLAFTLEKLFEKFGVDGNLTLQRYEGIGGIGGSVDTALGAAMRQASGAGTADHLRRLIVPGLATWDPAANAAKRLVAAEAELLGGKRSELTPLANALVTNRLLTRGAGTLEVAHEALLRRPPIDSWLAEQKDALKLRDDVLREAKEWNTGGKHDDGLVRRGARLESALDLLAKPDFVAILAPASEYLDASRRLESAGRLRARRVQALVHVLLVGVIGGLIGWINQGFIKEQWNWYWTVRPFAAANIWPYVRAAEAERALKPGDQFRDCAPVQGKDYCPEMVVLPVGEFMMGSPPDDRGRGGAGAQGPHRADQPRSRRVRINERMARGGAACAACAWDGWPSCIRRRFG
jgi:hypothetical protein